MKASDFNMYKDDQGQVVLEVYGLKDQDTKQAELVEKLYFASFDAARFYILKNF